ARKPWSECSRRGSFSAKDPRRNDRDHPIAGEFFHEQIQEKGIHQLQRKNRGLSLAAGRGAGRQAANKRRRVAAAAGSNSIMQGGRESARASRDHSGGGPKPGGGSLLLDIASFASAA